MRKKLVIGNWKMNGQRSLNSERASHLISLTASLSSVGIAVCPPFPYLAQLSGLLFGSHVHIGAQNLCAFASGAYTGEVSAHMLVDSGCRYVLVGHSERRTLFGETDVDVTRKVELAQHAGLTPVICVGETLAQREAGETDSVIIGQLRAITDTLGVEALDKAVVAYEPVWAIGTGLSASPEQAQAVHERIRQWVAAQSPQLADTLQILYGGSVNAQNARSIFAQPDVDGGLIGGASLDPAIFAQICRLAGDSEKVAV
ncbi:triose-phosphate isomerase [Nitrincola alkalilacustris]|uniref:triose-phosphate isomerase n=1 Tax=Nitrincola alkalilacustris TaxID=1571224 RepID=UPI00124E7102|nr:triose-phosphate isomerase [Nitrincola alkalilacustris]